MHIILVKLYKKIYKTKSIGNFTRSILIIFSLMLNSVLAFSQVSFTTDVTQGCGPLTVNFSNTSDPSVVSFILYLGDGSSTGDPNASYTYNVPGDYYPYMYGYDIDGNYMGYTQSYIRVEGAGNI